MHHVVLRDYTNRCNLAGMSTFKSYFLALSIDDRTVFAGRCKTTRKHMTNVAYGYKTCAESLAINIERESRGAVRCEDLRPDVDWAYLRGTAAANQPTQEAA